MSDTMPVHDKLTLAHMQRYLQSFCAQSLDDTVRARVRRGISDFCWNAARVSPADLTEAAGLPSGHPAKRRLPATSKLNAFAQQLSAMEGECVFLLRDAFDPMERYRAITGRGFGIPANRRSLCSDESEYYRLTELLYEALATVDCEEAFWAQYVTGLRAMFASTPRLKARAKEMAAMVSYRTTDRKVLLVDVGFQFTCSMFVAAAMQEFGSKLAVTYYSYTAYPWLMPVFGRRVFTEANEEGMSYERMSAHAYGEHRKGIVRGGLLGFAIGDACGWPAAGVPAEVVQDQLGGRIESFTSNPHHPILGGLVAGQVTANTEICRLAAESLVECEGFDLEDQAARLLNWWRRWTSADEPPRWPGPTLAAALERMSRGIPPSESGVKQTESSSCCYRVIPIGLVLPVRTEQEVRYLIECAVQSARMTHDSAVSAAGSSLVALTCAFLKEGRTPIEAVKESLNATSFLCSGAGRLLDAVSEAAECCYSMDVSAARRRFGTGASATSTISMSLYLFLRFAGFEEALLAAANSFRVDGPNEREVLAQLSEADAARQCNGGNTDGIAALTSALAGVRLGVSGIPECWRKVEKSAGLVRLADQLEEVSQRR